YRVTGPNVDSDAITFQFHIGYRRGYINCVSGIRAESPHSLYPVPDTPERDTHRGVMQALRT
ncbi:MAG: hypothetical protein K2X97_20025, partial [Mycobacteriaceae bacterium]|nr:hypothetical protein [Mycobacteriaceae bacterium]